MKVSLVIYTLNEREGMGIIMPQISKDWYDQLLVIDGGSTDGTVEYCREMGYPVHVQKERRWGGAYKEAFERVTGDIIVDFSPDGNSPPEVIPRLVAKMREGYDMVIASRYTAGAFSEDDTPITRLGNKLFTVIVNLLFGSRYTDTLVILRAYHRSFLERAGLMGCALDQCGTMLLSIRCAKIGGKFADIPGDEPKRLAGRQKMNIVIDGLRVAAIILKEFIFYNVKIASRILVRW